jgi:hypothetical protein
MTCVEGGDGLRTLLATNVTLNTAFGVLLPHEELLAGSR